MTVDKAIEILESTPAASLMSKLPEVYRAMLLSIEALKEYKRLRKLLPPISEYLLPGETKE